MNAEPTFWAELLWVVMGVGLVGYAVTGGADLGVGFWSLVARGPRKAEQRTAILHAIAPIWEANHVWLIFVIVVLFSAFSRAFAALSTALHIPIALALVGIVFRGSAYIFHAYGLHAEAASERWQRVFGWASALTPVALGLVVGGVSSGQIRVVDHEVVTGFWVGWTTPFAFGVGVFSLSLFALLSATYLSAETEGMVSEDFRMRALAMEAVCAVFAALVFLLARRGAPDLYRELAASRFTWPIQLGTAALASLSVFMLLTRRERLARYTTAAQVALILIGWGLALRQHFILPDVSLASATTNTEVLPTFALILFCGSLVLGPALVYLYWVFKRSPHDSGDH